MTKSNLFSGLMMLLIFSGCQSMVHKKSLSPEEQANYISKGRMITALSLKALSGEVMQAINEGGVQHAVDYCKVHASPLVDSLAMQHQVRISRVSEKFRNPENKPDALDMTVLDAYHKQLASGEELQPHLEATGNRVIYYSPIIILNPVCLNCHGEPGSTAAQENIDFIQTRYPGDLATGYKLGDLRGVWKIELK